MSSPIFTSFVLFFGASFFVRYMFTRHGFNVRPVEAEGAIAIVQLNRLAGFNSNRRQNYDLMKKVRQLRHFYIKIISWTIARILSTLYHPQPAVRYALRSAHA